jgi:hypothetical protein
MDAARKAREEKKQQLFAQLTELMIEEQRELGTFDQVPHFSRLEQAAHVLGQQLSQATQRRAAAEVAATGQATATCPACGREQVIATKTRVVTSLDGPVELLEQVAHCPACRRNFFPSA